MPDEIEKLVTEAESTIKEEAAKIDAKATKEAPAVEANVKIVATDAEGILERVHTAIDAWFIKHFHNGPASQQEQIITLLHAAKDDLKNEISKL